MHWNDDYLDLLNQVDHERFLNNLIEPTFQRFISIYNSEQIFFQHTLSCYNIRIAKIDPTSKAVYHYTHFPTPTHYYNLLSYINCKTAFKSSSEEKLHSILLRKYSEIGLTTRKTGISLRELLHSDNVSEDDKNILSNLYLDAFQAHEIYQAITDWLAEREEAARQKPSSDDKFADY